MFFIFKKIFTRFSLLLVMKYFFFSLFLYQGLFAQKFNFSDCVKIAFQKNYEVQKNVFEKNIQMLNLRIAKREFLPAINTNIINNMTFGVDQDVFGLTKRNDNLNSSALIG